MTGTAAAAPADRTHALELLSQMLLIRRFEEKCAELYSSGHIRGFLHLYIGEEAIAVGVMQALESDDAVVATYREHGHALARGLEPGAVMAEMLGKREGSSRGRGGSCASAASGIRALSAAAAIPERTTTLFSFRRL